MLNKVLPLVYEEWHTLTLRYELVNEGIDGEAGLWGQVAGLEPDWTASSHSSRVTEASETAIEAHRRDHPEDEYMKKYPWGILDHKESFHQTDNCIYNSEGLVVLSHQDAYDLEEHYTWNHNKPELEKKSWQ